MRNQRGLMLLASCATALLAVAACSSSANDAKQQAMNACGIVIDDATGQVGFEGIPPELSDPRDETQTRVDAWRAYSRSASTAASLDPAFEALRNAATTVYNVKSKAVSAVNQYGREGFAQGFTQSDVDAHNGALSTWEVECGALADRL